MPGRAGRRKETWSPFHSGGPEGHWHCRLTRFTVQDVDTERVREAALTLKGHFYLGAAMLLIYRHCVWSAAGQRIVSTQNVEISIFLE